ncbi:Enoyl-CoA hydratase 2, peroxisomal [Hibiscus syriacus]|uniref:Enoyl-CoA hydratase 2, peroxisomal n=1 Tax=Hibiscus syriacus TaxID=106335 RepID=A0A6A2Y323_HIBSY|nr:Enoyl-CoA hydratase 2, peroxisomal [Hibiscus syriacus]
MVDNSACNPELVLAHKFSEEIITYTERDVAVYALGVGACGRDAVDTGELKYVYDENGQQFIKVLPTFSTLFSLGVLPQICSMPGLQFDKRLVLHGQQYIEIYKPLPANATIHSKVTVAGLHDKGKASVLEIETRSYKKESGELLSLNRTSVFLRGAGGFSDPSKPFTYSNYPALLYRLSGDYNPLHSDPMIGKAAGGDPDMIKNIFARFLLHVYPGEALITEMWIEDFRVIYQVKVKERNRAVLSGYVQLHHRLAASL